MEKRMTPLRAIRANCLQCMGGSAKEVKRCNMPECPLHGFRFGRNPNLKGKRGNGQSLKEYRLFKKNSCIDKGNLGNSSRLNGLMQGGELTLKNGGALNGCAGKGRGPP